MVATMPPMGTTTSPVPFVVAVVLLVIISLGVHEAAHAQVALWCGDPTARDLGRITLNPIPHIDLFGTILLPAMLAFAGAPIFGGAKPVPVRMDKLRHGMRDMALVALAGPISNILLAFFFGILFAFLMKFNVYHETQLMPKILSAAVFFNVLLAVFNMIPIPPLDGSRVLAWILPKELRPAYVNLERYGLFLVFGLIFFVPGFSGLIWSAITPLLDFVNDVSYKVVNPIAGLFQ